MSTNDYWIMGIISIFCVIIIVVFIQNNICNSQEINTLWKEKTQMMEVLVNNGLARYIVDPVDGKTASITYLIKDNQK